MFFAASSSDPGINSTSQPGFLEGPCHKTAMHLSLSCLVVLLFFGQLSVVVSIEVVDYYPEERAGLMQLRDVVNSTLDLHANWTGPPCINNQSQWAGIACSNWHIIHIVLEGVQLTGSLPNSFLHNITYLTRLSFSNNSVFGPLPNLTNLVHLQDVSFSYNHFSGSIPLEFIRLPKLTMLELRRNALSGHIPPFDQPNLRTFNVSYNILEGSIPTTSVLQSFPKSSYHHNPDLCGSPLGKACPVLPPGPSSAPPPPLPIPLNPPPKDKNSKNNNLQLWSIALIAAAAALVPILGMGLFLCYYKRMHRREASKGEHAPAGEGSMAGEERKMARSESAEDPERTVELKFVDKSILTFDLDDLLRASAEVLGKGKLGTTYKAMLESGSVIAVKRLKEMNGLSKKEFIQQMQLLGRMRHENLVEIISFYYSKEEKLVVYEFVPHGNLFELLHENRGIGRVPLNWRTRLSIVKDVAKGLTFLHQTLPSHKVPHGNLKSSNVIFQANYHSKLTDFGFLSLLPARKSSQKLAVGRSPEFIQGKKLTHKADVYCFGIILLEIITGRIPGEFSPAGNEEMAEDDLSDWVRTVVNNDWSTDVLDIEILAAKEGHDEMLKLTKIALECTDAVPEKRPMMSQVLRRIQEIDHQANKEND